jgi:hypothetical protein
VRKDEKKGEITKIGKGMSKGKEEKEGKEGKDNGGKPRK